MNIRRFSVPALLDLLAIISHGSINRAAQELNITQSSLTRSVKRLERTLGVQLLNRTAAGTTPTLFGQMLIEHTRVIERQLSQAAQQLEQMREAVGEELQIGMSPTIANHVGSVAVAALVRSRPRLSVRLVEAGRSLLLSELRTGRLEHIVAVIHADDAMPDLDVTPLFQDELAIIVRRGHPLAAAPPRSLADLVDRDWVLPDYGSALLRRIGTVLESQGVALPRSGIFTGSFLAIKRIVLDTDRIAAISMHMVESEIRSGELVALSGPWRLAERSYGLFSRAGEPVSPASRAFIGCLRDAVREAGLPAGDLTRPECAGPGAGGSGASGHDSIDAPDLSSREPEGDDPHHAIVRN